MEQAAASGRAGAGTTGVLLLNLGGPDREQAVRPFLLNLFRDPDVLAVPGGAPVRHALAWLIATLRAPRVWRNYAEVGGSPLLPRTRAQERALERRLNELAAAGGGGRRYAVRTAMRYWHPRAEEALRELDAEGADELIALPLYPHSCRATTGSSVKELRGLLARRADRRPLRVVGSWACDARYLDALARCVQEAIWAARSRAGVPGPRAAAAGEPTLLFSAHGLPQRIVDSGDPYLDEIRATVAGVMARLPGFRGEPVLAFQSRAGPVKWLEPATDATIDRLGSSGVRTIVIVPVSFVSDHIETVHEIDVQLAARARAAGVTTFVRSEALDVRSDFIDALAGLVLGRVAGLPGGDVATPPLCASR